MNKHDIRSKGTKTDEDLAREWIDSKKIVNRYDKSGLPYVGFADPEKADLIEKELGKERLEFFVHKIKTEDRLKEIEEKIKKIANSGDIPSGITISLGTDFVQTEKKSFFSRCWRFIKNIDFDVNILLITILTIFIAVALFLILCQR